MTERQTDDMHLEWLDRFMYGETCESIGASWGKSKSAVAGLIHRIKHADKHVCGLGVLDAYERQP